MILALEDMTCGYDGRPVLSHVSLTVHEGQTLCILGPNGVGKTTLFKSMLGLLRPLAGRVTIDGDDIAAWSNRRRAQHIGYIPQSHVPPFPYTAMQVITMGRVSSMGMFASPSPQDRAVAQEAVETLGLAGIADCVYTELSGGERQMVLVARALAQSPRMLLMDEPTANLDFGNQAKVLACVRRLAASGMIVVMTTHAPDHAFICSSQVALVEGGDRYTAGPAEEVVTPQNLRRVYGVDVGILQGEACGEHVRTCVPVVR